MKQSPSKQCKDAGLQSLAEVSRMTKKCAPTLHNWAKNNPELFSVVVAGCVAIKNGR